MHEYFMHHMADLFERKCDEMIFGGSKYLTWVMDIKDFVNPGLVATETPLVENVMAIYK